MWYLTGGISQLNNLVAMFLIISRQPGKDFIIFLFSEDYFNVKPREISEDSFKKAGGRNVLYSSVIT